MQLQKEVAFMIAAFVSTNDKSDTSGSTQEFSQILPDACAAGDPLIIGLHQLFKVCICQYCLWDTAPAASQSAACRGHSN